MKVKKLNAGQEYGRLELASGKTIIWQANVGCYAVTDDQGRVVFTKKMNGRGYAAEVFDLRRAAQQEADYLNRHPELETRVRS